MSGDDGFGTSDVIIQDRPVFPRGVLVGLVGLPIVKPDNTVKTDRGGDRRVVRVEPPRPSVADSLRSDAEPLLGTLDRTPVEASVLGAPLERLGGDGSVCKL